MEQYTTLKVSDDPTLEKIPAQLPTTRELEFNNFKNLKPKIDGVYTTLYPPNAENPHWQFVDRSYIPSGHYLRSFKDLPENLPNLESIGFRKSNITTFVDLTAKMPKLKNIGFSDCYIHSLLGIPINHLVFHGTTIDSFEGLELTVPHNNKERQIYLENCTIRSLGGGISRSTIQAILIAILNQDYEDQGNNWYKNKHLIKLDLTHTGINLLHEAINTDIELEYSPKHNTDWMLQNFYFTHRDEWHFIIEEGFTQDFGDASKNEWIYGFQLTERLFISENLDILHEYYRKTTRELAQEYVTDQTSLSPELIERLIHEADHNLRRLLENSLPPENPVLSEISTKFNFETKNGLKILK